MSLVIREFEDAVATLTLNRPERANALSRDLVAELGAALEDPEVRRRRVVILHGAGRHFCAGADLEELAEAGAAPEAGRLAAASALGDVYRAVLQCPSITIAAVSGAASGGGVGLAAACDLVIADPASRWQLSELRLGFVPALIAVFLGRRLDAARLGAMVLSPAAIAGQDAVAAGLADETADNPLECARERAVHLARTVSPEAVAVTKRWLLELALPDLERRLDEGARINARQQASPECRWGVERFLADRRFPDWLDRETT